MLDSMIGLKHSDDDLEINGRRPTESKKFEKIDLLTVATQIPNKNSF